MGTGILKTPLAKNVRRGSALGSVSVITIIALSGLTGCDQNSTEIQNKAEFLEQTLREFNQKYADIAYPEVRIRDDVYEEVCRKQNPKPNTTEKKEATVNELCSKLAPILDSGSTCSDFIEVTEDFTYTYAWSKMPWNYFDEGTCDVQPHLQLTASLTDKAKALIANHFFYDSSNATVDYNVRSIATALAQLQLLPRQRKTLDGFWNATTNFQKAIDAEKAKATKGEKTLPLTHRSFVERASLLVAYYRYLKDDFAELAQFGSEASGISKINQNAVTVINQSIQHIIDDYGLDTDVVSKRVADYGRVLMDLLNNFSQTLSLNEKSQYVQPILAELVTQVIPISEANGDVASEASVEDLRDLWQADGFRKFLEEKLSASDDKTTTLILNMSAAVHKIGLSANVDIRTFDARDVERIQNPK